MLLSKHLTKVVSVTALLCNVNINAFTTAFQQLPSVVNSNANTIIPKTSKGPFTSTSISAFDPLNKFNLSGDNGNKKDDENNPPASKTFVLKKAGSGGGGNANNDKPKKLSKVEQQRLKNEKAMRTRSIANPKKKVNPPPAAASKPKPKPKPAAKGKAGAGAGTAKPAKTPTTNISSFFKKADNSADSNSDAKPAAKGKAGAGAGTAKPVKTPTTNISNFFKKADNNANSNSDAKPAAKGKAGAGAGAAKPKAKPKPSPSLNLKSSSASSRISANINADANTEAKTPPKNKDKKVSGNNFFSAFSNKSQPSASATASSKPKAKPSPKPSPATTYSASGNSGTETSPGGFFMKTTPIQKLKAKEENDSVSPAAASTSKASSASASDNSVSNFMSKLKSPLDKLNIPSSTPSSGSKPAKVELKPNEEIITNDITGFTTTIINSTPQPLDPEEKSQFTFEQRIESIKTGVVGLLAGGIALTPFAALHDLVLADESIANGMAQWEFDTDTGSIAAALFAIVYRYCVRDGEEKNEMLQMGVIGAFVVVRTLSRIRVPVYCSSAPLDCGEPLGYFDWTMIQEGVGSGLESVVMFGVAALAVEYCYDKGYISRFK